MKTTKTKVKKFSSVEQIFKSYIPNYSPQKDNKYNLNGKTGVQLAKNILSKFQSAMRNTREKSK